MASPETDMTLTWKVTSRMRFLKVAVRFWCEKVMRRCCVAAAAAGLKTTGEMPGPEVSTMSNVLPSGHARCEQSGPVHAKREGRSKPYCL